jgi:glycosyltransferase involved in cell wall biosynthesis
MPVSVIIITYNESDNIRECLESVKWADEIIIIDSGSTDDTLKIAAVYTNNIIIETGLSYGLKRNVGFEKAKCDWILWLDTDERISEALKEEIIFAISKPDYEAYFINRKSFFLNKFIKHCGWYPDYTLRLFKKSPGLRFNTVRVHEKIVYDGKSGKLHNNIIHYTDTTLQHYLTKMNNYTTLSAMDLFDSGKRAGIFDIIFRPVFTFIKMYFLKAGFLDGFTGLELCIYSSFHVLTKYSKLYHINKQNNGIS